MNIQQYNEGLFSFLEKSTSPFHATRTMIDFFKKSGYTRLEETVSFPEKLTGGYYLIREDGTFVSFFIGADQDEGFRIVGTHSDSPSLQLKPLPFRSEQGYLQLGVETYGGTLLHTWFDRELCLAGRLHCADTAGNIHGFLFDSNRPIAIIPNLAIHLDRKANSKKSINAQKDIFPIIGLETNEHFDFNQYLFEEINATTDLNLEKVLGFDLFFYDNRPPGYCGINDDFIVGSRLDNLLSCYIACTSLQISTPRNNLMFICNNHEEIGSSSRSGAGGNFFNALFERLYPDTDKRYAALAKSHLISLDNAHAVHPNHVDKNDPEHPVSLNLGPVIKINAGQRYASTSYSHSLFHLIAEETGVNTQNFVMRNDMACGSTIGPLIAAKVGISTVDVGVPTLAMHSIRELTGNRDPWLMHQVVSHYFNRERFPISTPCV